MGELRELYPNMHVGELCTCMYMGMGSQTLRVRRIEEDRSGGGVGVWAGEVDTVREPGVRRTPSESIGIDYGPCSGPDLPAECPSTIKTSYNEVANGSTDEYSVSIGSPCFSNASALGGGSVVWEEGGRSQ